MHPATTPAATLDPAVSAVPRPRAERPVRLAIVTSHPIQYAAPLYAYLSRDPALAVTVLYCSDFSVRGARDPGFGQELAWDIDLLEGYDSIFLGERSRTRTVGGFWSLICPELAWEIRRSQYDAVWIHGQQFAAYVLAFAIAKLQGIPVLTRGDTHLGLSRPPLRAAVRRVLLGLQYRHIDRFLAIGSRNRAYYRSFGVPEQRIFDVPFSVDNERFARGAALSPGARRAARARLGAKEGQVVLLYASKLMRRKHPDDLLRAAARLLSRGHAVHVVIVGSGELDQELRQLAAGLDLLEHVCFAGFVNQRALPELYAACDVFVLPAEDEPWGLIVNEVMAAGLPVVVGADVGCAPDLVEPGVNGCLCEPGNPAALAAVLEPLVADAALRRRMGEASRRRITSHGYEQCRLGLRAALVGLRVGRA
jgi:glycosyltransferase involved in cell wall biosynthesis